MMASNVSQSLDDVFAKLDAFSEKVKTNVVFVGSQAAAEVFYREAKLNCPVSSKGHWFHGTQFKVNGTKYWFDPGSLRNAIYQVNSKDKSGNGKATYEVSWNHTAPAPKGCPYGFMVEYGTARAPGVGFMRRAFESAKADALINAKAAMSEYLETHK